jgi:uncharacterized protein (TIGR02246 family)
MNRHARGLIGAVAVLAAAALLGSFYRSAAQDRAAAGSDKAEAKDESPDLAAVRKTAEEFVKAFNDGDAKALAALWTKDGEYTGPDGEKIRGRDALEKDYVEFFKTHPKASIEVHVDALRLLGKYAALEEGTLKLLLPGDKEPSVSRYSAVHVREEDGWRTASVREWVPDPQELVSLQDVEWLLGDWLARSDEAEVRITYAWDEDRAFLRGRYTVKRGGKVAASGTQIIGKNPLGGLHSWVFDSSSSFGESSWSRDQNRWVMVAAGTLPDGTEATATNILIPLGKDAFTWQSIERTLAGTPVPDLPPVKVSRVKADK